VRDEALREKAKKDAYRFFASDDANADLRERLIALVIDLWGERFGLAAAG